MLSPPLAVGVAVANASVVSQYAPFDNVVSVDKEMDDAAATARLDKLRADPLSRTLPAGLQSALSQAVRTFPLRIMIVDNSGSMNAADGSRVVNASGWFGEQAMREIQCTRWEELGDDVVEMAKLSTALNARTDFHLLNASSGIQAFTVARDAYSLVPALGASGDVDMAKASMRTSPCGTTPLTESVMRIVSMVSPRSAELRARGEQVAVIIATDGLPNDRRTFLSAMQTLQRLPVFVIVRLCTDCSSVVDYWNDLDRDLEAPLEVLDDLRSEAKEIRQFNPWLTYGGPLHLCRLFGLPGRLFDAIDETSLTPFQCKQFIEELLGVRIDADPRLEEQKFLTDVKAALDLTPRVINPITMRQKPWLDVNELQRAVRPKQSGCAIM